MNVTHLSHYVPTDHKRVSGGPFMSHEGPFVSLGSYSRHLGVTMEAKVVLRRVKAGGLTNTDGVDEREASDVEVADSRAPLVPHMH